MLTLILACAPAPALQRCNGAAELCDRPLDEVVFPATHNSMSAEDDGYVAPNQHHGIPQQLSDGVRGFLMDTTLWEGEPYLCHGSCELGATPLLDVLVGVRLFLQTHPDEVLIFILQDDLSAEATAAVFEAAGLTGQLITHPDGERWPTLAELIAADTRILVMAEGGGPPPDWYHHAWDLTWDTPYEYSDPSEFSCALNRGSQDNDLFLINHWLGPVPWDEKTAYVNDWDTLYPRVGDCVAQTGRLPTLVAVDFYDQGALFEVVSAYNAG